MENSQKISEIFRYFLEPIFKKKTVKKETISNTFRRETFLDENDHGYDDASVKKFQWDLNEDSSPRVGCNIRLNLARNA